MKYNAVPFSELLGNKSLSSEISHCSELRVWQKQSKKNTKKSKKREDFDYPFLLVKLFKNMIFDQKFQFHDVSECKGGQTNNQKDSTTFILNRTVFQV